MRGELARAAYDYLTLLARGHRHRDRILALLAATYHLAPEEKIFLKRCIHPPSDSRSIAAKLTPPSRVKGKTLIIDLPNQASPIKAILKGGGYLVARCTDGLTRDSALGATRPTPRDTETYNTIARVVDQLEPAKTIIIIDSAIPHSGETAATIRRIIPEAITATSRKADTTIIKRSMRGDTITASSDIVIARRARRLIDLAGLAITRIIGVEITDLRRILRQQHREWCSQEPVGP